MGKKQIVKSPQVIFLIGAGASVQLGIPAMQGMFKAFMNKAKSGITKEEHKFCKMFIEELGVKEDLEEFLLAANKIIELDDISLSMFVERLISPRTSARRTTYKEKLDKDIESVRTVRTKILDFMSRTCFQFNRPKACDIFKAFITAVAKYGYPVYTTNYDFALEHVAQEKNIHIEDNFKPKRQRHIWNPEINFPTGDALTIIQLHGSVAWYADETGTIEKIHTDSKINQAGYDIKRLVVFPTRFKDIYEQHFFSLYSHFLSALSKTKCLIVIGHSLRDEYLRASIIERCRETDFKVIIIDPEYPEELPDEMTPAKVGLSGKITHIPYCFENFSDELASIISDVEPINIADKCAEIVHHNKSKKNKIKLKGDIRSLKANEEKKFEAVIDAYLQPDEKPAYVRVWLKATYQEDGVTQNKVSGTFLENKEIQIAKGLSGMVKKQLPIIIEVPKYSKWLDHAEKVTLCIAILKKNIKSPSNAQRHILAKDSRKLRYTC